MSYSDSGGPIATVMESYKRAFDFSGRATRTELLYFTITSIVLSNLLMLAVQITTGSATSSEGMLFWFALAQWLAFYPVFALVGRRLQDFGVPSYWSTVIFAPQVISILAQLFDPALFSASPIASIALIGLSLMALCGWLGALFVPGSPEENAYGHNPRFDAVE
jgi:uncharacterized membrane protein YhaH (DUF805 family)